MSECIKWESVIPNFQEGDIITPFESYFERFREADYILDGGINHDDLLESYAAIRKKNTLKVGVYNKNGEQILPEEFDNCEPTNYNSGDFYVTAIKVQKEGLFGLYSQSGTMIVPAQFISVWIQDYFVIVRNCNKLYGAYFTDGRIFVDCEFCG